MIGSLYDHDAPDDETLADAYRIQDGSDAEYEVYGPGFGKLLATGGWNVIRAAIIHHQNDQQYWPDVYLVNDHGNISLINIRTDEEVASWV